MSWKDDLKQITEQNERLMHMMKVLQGQGVLNAKRIEALKLIIDQQTEGANRSADRMADRMIEMAMVNQGRSVEAASHRRTLEESIVGGVDLWEDDPDSQWPPPGCDAVQMP